ncbi:putative dehydrogenase [Mesotoga infera]|uniref:Putative dehydrogenase n=1 Tax=Mesotoga infera TaxID=1236046 RepID=A0A7Z7LHL0_9BACT|nr:Gfo/Idh/MocA family oxidoreductase [Mesotoga infera]SSC14253.1 putative dehydrogenase [Mesotoga infera]
MMKIAILGIAHMHGYSYVRALKRMNDIEITGLFDEDRSRMSTACKELGVKPYEHPEELVAGSDGVIVTSENSTHRKFVEIAAKAGKHVLCEKPIATSVEDAEAMIEICRRNSVKLQMAFPVRYSASVRKAREIITGGLLGEVVSLVGTNHGRMPGGWFTDPVLGGGGAVMDHTVHVVDIVRWLLNCEFTQVYATYGTLIHDIPVEDCGLEMFKLSTGQYMTLDCSWSRPKAHPYWGDVTLHIVGTRGTLFLDVFNSKIEVYSNEKGNRWENYGDNLDSLMIEEFLKVLREGKEPFTEGNDGLQSLKVVMAAYRSFREGKVVEV